MFRLENLSGELDNLEIKQAIVLITDLLVELNDKPEKYKELKEITHNFEVSINLVNEIGKKFIKTGKF